ncbi:unnamed protein product, partial [Acidithrix sp. C25]
VEQISLGKIADQYLKATTELDPTSATYFGLAGANDSFGDYSPDGARASLDLAISTLAQLSKVTISNDKDRIAKESMVERLGLIVDLFESKEHLRNLNVIESPPQQIRQIFDLMKKETDDDFSDIAARLSRVPSALIGYQKSLEEGLRLGVAASPRQASEVAKQARAYGGSDNVGFFASLITEYEGSNTQVKNDLASGAEVASLAYLELAQYLSFYAQRSNAKDAIGPDRWALECRRFNGIEIDPTEAYEWGWNEVFRIDDEMVSIARDLYPNATFEEALIALDERPGYVIEGVETFRDWNQGLLDNTISELNGVHFDIPVPIQKLQAMIAPPGGAAAMYYTGPSADLSRPGRTWYPTLGRNRFPLWTEVSTAYHEGVPGHHLQIGYITYMGEELNSFSRLLGEISGHIEGWALYAERLMDELGYLGDPVYRLGMLSAQAMRAARVVIDIGLHHGFMIPPGHRFLKAGPWTIENAINLLQATSGRERAFAVSEIDRYLGWPAQATSYKIGERIWRATREASKKAQGKDFSLSRFHQKGFELGFVGLAQLQRELGH